MADEPQPTRGSADPGAERAEPPSPEVLDDELVEEAGVVPRLDADDEPTDAGSARFDGSRGGSGVREAAIRDEAAERTGADEPERR